MIKICTFSQDSTFGDPDVYIEHGVELRPGDERRDSIFGLVSDVFEKGLCVYTSDRADVWSLKKKIVIVLHTDSLDPSDRVIDVMIFLYDFSLPLSRDLYEQVFSAIDKHFERVPLDRPRGISADMARAFERVEKKLERSAISKLVNWLIGLVRGIFS